MHNGEPHDEEKTQNLGPKPILSSIKQVMQRGAQKNWTTFTFMNLSGVGWRELN
jgi:hypothetical protein